MMMLRLVMYTPKRAMFKVNFATLSIPTMMVRLWFVSLISLMMVRKIH
jgi:hypothetical protein